MTNPNKYPVGSKLIYKDAEPFTANYIKYDSRGKCWYSPDGLSYYSEDKVVHEGATPMERAEKIYNECKIVYGTCTDGSFEMCLSHNGYYATLKEAGK